MTYAQAVDEYLVFPVGAFMDLEKAYDRVDREALRLYRVGENLLNAVQSFYVDSRACVRVGSETSEWFSVKVGLRQGCIISLAVQPLHGWSG